MPIALAVPVAVAVTVTVQIFEVIFEPSVELAAMFAVPACTPVIAPDELTLTIVGLLDCHVSAGLVAFAGRTVAVSGVVNPILTVAVDGIVIDVTRMLAA